MTNSNPLNQGEDGRVLIELSDRELMLADLEYVECAHCAGTGCPECKDEGVVPVWTPSGDDHA